MSGKESERENGSVRGREEGGKIGEKRGKKK